MNSKHLFLPLLIAAICGRLLAAETPPKPDILIIMPDQMRGDCLSAVGHPVVRTPHLDELAKEGMLFRRAYSTVPSCIPARYAMLTGLFPQTSGVVGYHAKKMECPTMPNCLAAAGYATVMVGRNMHQSPSPSLHYERQILGSVYVANDDYDTFLKNAAPATGGIKKLVHDLGITFNGWQAAPWPVADELHPTAWIVRQSRKVIAETPAEKPLFLTSSFYSPHPPLFPPKKYFDRYMQQKLPPPARGDWVDWKALPPSSKGKELHRVLLEGKTLQAAQAGYFGLIEHIDDRIVPLVEDFKKRSEKAGRPWIIVFTADHGELLGDHGYYRKCEPYEGCANIPFIIVGSAGLGFRPGERSSQPVCLEDILPTLLDLAGAKRPKVMDGISLVPVLRGQTQEVRPWLHSEHAPCYGKEQAFHALTDGRYKYVWRPTDGAEQLFDLQTDPREEHDLAKVAAHRATLDQWRAMLVKRLANRPEGFSDGKRLIAGRKYQPIQAGK